MINLKRIAHMAGDQPLPLPRSPEEIAARIDPAIELNATRERFDDFERQIGAVKNEFADLREEASRSISVEPLSARPRAALGQPAANSTERAQSA